MEVMPAELDYKSRVNGKGGSPKGRDVRRCPVELKDLAHDLALELIAHGNESYFTHNPNAKGRFTKKVFTPIVPMLWSMLPEQCQEYFGGREDNAAYLISQRFHKMYWYSDGKIKSRGISNEHPQRRKKS